MLQAELEDWNRVVTTCFLNRRYSVKGWLGALRNTLSPLYESSVPLSAAPPRCRDRGEHSEHQTKPLAPVLTHKDATGCIRVSEKTSSRGCLKK
jgi:hypothetical protein